MQELNATDDDSRYGRLLLSYYLIDREDYIPVPPRWQKGSALPTRKINNMGGYYLTDSRDRNCERPCTYSWTRIA